MPGPDLDSILLELRGDYSKNPYAFKSSRKNNIPTKINTGEVQDVKYNVHMDAIYDRLNDGTYIPKFENYAGGIGNEDRLAKEQTGFEQAWKGLTKAGAKTFNYALDATVGTAYGIFNAIGEGSWEGLYDNDFSNKIDDWNTKLDHNLPNYYTKEQKSQNVLQSMASVNFWANDVAGGLAFVGGALLPEIALAAITGGASAPLALAKMGLRAGTKSFLKTGTKKIVKEGIEAGVKKGAREGMDKVGVNLLRGHRLAKVGETTGEVLKTAGFLVRTSNFEAGMEARHNLHQANSEFLNNFESLNGRAPTFDEYSSFMDEAVNASNWVYGSNMAILAVSNLAMFGSKFGVGINVGKKMKNFGNRAIGLGLKKTAGKEVALKGANRFQKGLGNTYLILGKPAIEGLYEEGLQGVAGNTMQNYLQAKYDPEYEEGYGLWSALTDGFAHQYGSKDGWKEMAIGMIIGMGAPMIQGQAPNGFGKNSRKNREKNLQNSIDVSNKGQVILKNMDRANSMVGFRNRMESQESVDEDTDISNTIINTEFIKTQEHLKTAREIENDFNAIIETTDFSEEQIEDLGGVENAAAYKELLKDNFAKDSKNYRAAKSLVKSIGLGGKLKNTPGDIQEIGEALTLSFMVGKTSLSKAENIAKQIDDLIGADGTFSHLEHYNNLSQDKKNKVADLKKKKRQLRDAKKLAIKSGQQLEGVQTQTGRKLAPETVQKNYLKYSEKAVLAQQAVTALEDEITTITEALDLDFRAENIALDGTLATDPTLQSTETMLEEIDKLDSYVASLEKAGKTGDATAVKALMTEFKMYSDSHRQMNSDFRRMFDTNFFRKTKEGKALTNTIIGRKYVMSDEFRELIRENDELIDASLGKAGVRGYISVEQLVQDTIEGNEELSEREKYRRESIIRTLLGAARLQVRLAESQAEHQEIVESIQEADSTDPLKGDTVTLKKKISPEGKDLSNLDVINQMINEITDEIDALRRIGGYEQDVQNLEAKVSQLKEIEVEEEVAEGEHEKALAASKVAEEELTEEQKALLASYKTFVEKENAIKKAEKELKDFKANRKFKIVSTEEYKKLEELTEKKQNGTITPDELIELEDVTEDIDNWIMLTGTVVEGLRLSDLIKQKIVLENTPIADLEDVGEVTDQEVIDQIDISDKTGAVNYSYGQTFEGVTAINTQEGIEISGIKPAAFSELTGVTDFKTNKQGNVLITKDVQQEINAGGILSILPTNKDLTTNYSVVLVTRPNLDGNTETKPLVSSFNADFNGEMNPDAIYDLSEGDELTLEVNPEDAYNQQLLEEYSKAMGTATTTEVTEEDINEAVSEDTRYQDLAFDLEVLEEEEAKATTDKKASLTKKKLKKKEALEKRKKQVEDKLIKQANKGNTKTSKKSLEEVQAELRRALVIRVKDQNGNFVAVLKAKRQSAVKSIESAQFEDFRDQVVSDAEFMQRLISTGVTEEVPVEGATFTKKVLIGHPNFNFSRNEDGTVSIESRSITEAQVQHIEDIGYVQSGKIFTKSKDTGINTTFISNSMKQEGDSKVPFVVITKGGTKFAYPVKISAQEKQDLQEFRDIYEGTINPVEKTIALNTYMAERGIDIKEPGNSFTVFNLEGGGAFFAEKLAQLESIDYYNELDSWLDPKVKIGTNVLGQTSINIDMLNPLHSPKIQMDLSGLEVETSTLRETEEGVEKSNKNTMQSGSGVENFLHKCK